MSASYDYKLQIDHNILKNCGMPCNDDIFFGSRERLFAKYWIGVSSSLMISVDIVIWYFVLYALKTIHCNVSKYVAGLVCTVRLLHIVHCADLLGGYEAL